MDAVNADAAAICDRYPTPSHPATQKGLEMEIAAGERVWLGVLRIRSTSIWWLYWALNWRDPTRAWVGKESRQILLDKIDDLESAAGEGERRDPGRRR